MPEVPYTAEWRPPPPSPRPPPTPPLPPPPTPPAPPPPSLLDPPPPPPEAGAVTPPAPSAPPCTTNVPGRAELAGFALALDFDAGSSAADSPMMRTRARTSSYAPASSALVEQPLPLPPPQQQEQAEQAEEEPTEPLLVATDLDDAAADPLPPTPRTAQAPQAAQPLSAAASAVPAVAFYPRGGAPSSGGAGIRFVGAGERVSDRERASLAAPGGAGGADAGTAAPALRRRRSGAPRSQPWRPEEPPASQSRLAGTSAGGGGSGGGSGSGSGSGGVSGGGVLMEDLVPVRMPEPRHRATGEMPPPRPVAATAAAAASVASSMTPAEAWAAAHPVQREEHARGDGGEQQVMSTGAPRVIVRPPAADGRTVELHESSVR